MQALVLAGGEGTRLRPLTLTTPKPVMPLAGRPFLTFMLDWLARHGVDEAILSCGFMSESVREVLGDIYAGMRLRYVLESEPLGTAGPVRLAADEGVLEERLLVLNGDVLTDMDLTAEIAFHEGKGALATLALIAVDDTASYGVVPTSDDGQVEAFLEKSAGPAPTNRINAGAYVLERSVADRIESGRAVSFEREVFPALVGEGLYGWHAEGYWIDIGTPERYLEATWDLLAGRVESSLPERDETGSLVYEPALTSGLRNTIVYAVVTSGLKVIIGLLLAALLTSRIRLRNLLRSIVFFPVLVSTVAVGITFAVLLHPSDGLVNLALGALGIDGPQWLSNPSLALLSVALVDVWKGVGIALVIFIAGILSIPEEYNEAVRLEGGALTQLRHITLPLSRNATFTVILLSFIGGLRTFDLIWTMTRGGPGFASDVIASTIYKQYQAGFYGLATAGNVILFIGVALLVYPMMRIFSRREIEL